MTFPGFPWAYEPWIQMSNPSINSNEKESTGGLEEISLRLQNKRLVWCHTRRGTDGEQTHRGPYRAERWRAGSGRRWWPGPETAAAGSLPPPGPGRSGSGSAVSGPVWPDTAGAAPGLAEHLNTRIYRKVIIINNPPSTLEINLFVIKSFIGFRDMHMKRKWCTPCTYTKVLRQKKHQNKYK